MLDEDFPQQTEDHINQFRDRESKFFLTKEERDIFTQDFDENKLEDEYQRGYQNAMVYFQRHMNLRNIVVQISNLLKKNNVDQDYTSKSHNTIAYKEKDDNEKS